uniref:Uncharacterized protein n=1 Tax=Candidatus Kentrum eta TaxID=2126337 RepID=A0A450UPM1_9GAMM|nr:MAG: hypothetical protein BECKH772A_GA0070896_1007213 [Candidatus Kentron sp. H]VFJ95368.1 MAG: hypothetical protein BECKH772B_GA0070898_1007513 [Candidatus Kentron sp. H]VFK01605.1 MAG: hypothetical protein BECKH772C_GA0070978_1006913 [Candidatus Kentron sp. H]
MSDSQTDRVSCSFAGKHSGDQSFFIAVEPSNQLVGLPERCVIGFDLTDPKSKEQAARVEKFLNDNLVGISITTW